METPALIYLGMGLVVARIELDGVQTRDYTWLQWLQYLFDAARIALLWPLVLFIEKLTAWLKSPPVLAGQNVVSRELTEARNAGLEPEVAQEEMP
jgi:hypothetical protein